MEEEEQPPALPQPAVGECHAPMDPKGEGGSFFNLLPSGARAAFGRPGADILYPSVAHSQYSTVGRPYLHSPQPYPGRGSAAPPPVQRTSYYLLLLVVW